MPFEVGDAFNVAVFRHQNHFGLRFGRLNANIDEVRSRRLGEYRRNITRAAEIDTADVQGLQHLRASREFHPGEFGVREAFFQQLVAFRQHHADAAFLIANAQTFRSRFCGMGQRAKRHQTCQSDAG